MLRLAGNLTRESADADSQLARLTDRLARSEERLTEIDAALVEGELSRGRLDQDLGSARVGLAELESEQEAAREQRVHWQVQEAHVAGGLRSAEERLARAEAMRAEAETAGQALAGELAHLDADIDRAHQPAGRVAGGARGPGDRAAPPREREQRGGVRAGAGGSDARRRPSATWSNRARLWNRGNEENHVLQVRLTEASGTRRSIVERVEAEWHRPFDQLLEGAPLLDLDLETLQAESARITEGLEAIGPVNALAVEEHAEEVKRLTFLTSQRDDLVGARQSLIQAIREIDGTARTMFLETFTAVQGNFLHVFQTLFGGGECELRLANPDDPLESEIDIHAAPRGKRTQRIHLLSSGERTLVAVSLLFSIYLTKPSPFCLMDEVDAPLDDANVGRFTRLLDEFKTGTQFLVITHNPRTMQAADAVYGVTMQEPGVSTIVGVRLGEREHA